MIVLEQFGVRIHDVVYLKLIVKVAKLTSYVWIPKSLIYTTTKEEKATHCFDFYQVYTSYQVLVTCHKTTQHSALRHLDLLFPSSAKAKW